MRGVVGAALIAVLLPAVAGAGEGPRVIVAEAKRLRLALFVVPAFYAALARRTRSPQYVSRAIARLRGVEAD